MKSFALLGLLSRIVFCESGLQLRASWEATLPAMLCPDVATVLWWLWKARNAFVFEDTDLTVDEKLRSIAQDLTPCGVTASGAPRIWPFCLLGGGLVSLVYLPC